MKILTIAESLGEGIIALPKTLWHGIERTGQDVGLGGLNSFDEAWGQNWRLLKLLYNIPRFAYAHAQNPLVQAIEIILKHYYETLPSCARKRIADEAINKMAYFAGKAYFNRLFVRAIAMKISKKIIGNSVLKKIARVAVKESGLILSIQGTIYESAQASQRLKAKFPKIYSEMKKRDLDMLYFLVEKPMAKYLNAIRMSRIFRQHYLEEVQKKYCR